MEANLQGVNRSLVREEKSWKYHLFLHDGDT